MPGSIHTHSPREAHLHRAAIMFAAAWSCSLEAARTQLNTLVEFYSTPRLEPDELRAVLILEEVDESPFLERRELRHRKDQQNRAIRKEKTHSKVRQKLARETARQQHRNPTRNHARRLVSRR